jgi:hypothetical protein
MSKAASPNRFPQRARKFRRSLAEVEHYARLILAHEQRPALAWATCVAEAEVHLWAIRSLLGPQEERAAVNAGAA